MGESNVKLVGYWPSPFALRARLALHLKSVSYEFIEENLLEPRSELLLKLNPLHKKIPVLIHHGEPIIESQAIVEYIDEVWPNAPSILPSDARQRADARIWVSYIDERADCRDRGCQEGSNSGTRRNGGNVGESLEKVEQRETFSSVEITSDTSTLHSVRSFSGSKSSTSLTRPSYFPEAKTPCLLRWAHKSFFSHAAVKDLLPDPEKLAEYAVKLRPILIARFASK
ncbi:hypothetical protein V6N12_034183 [Hibiscus sabdariffa]|uniref:Glutathione S-transferase n=1 Tax=Hibiscus sabdariffa TaxID=183260 RepID=A0ABR2BJ28_9ROSI